jgi:mono/diheme cytochrome c family protein
MSGWFGPTMLAAVLAACLPACSSGDASGPPSSAQPASIAEKAATQVGADWRPRFDIPLPPVVASKDPKIIAAGRYLFHAVAHCTSCHQPYGALIGVAFEEMYARLPTGGHDWQMGPWVAIHSPNITPDPETGVGRWTDAQLARAIQHAVDRDGRALILMNGIGHFDYQDVTALVSYLRTISPVVNAVPRTQYTQDGKETFSTRMQGFVKPRIQRTVAYAPPGEVSIARGAYLANGPARCVHCHSNLVDTPDIGFDGPPFAGSLWPEPDREQPDVETNAPNLTPSARFGVISRWPEQAFVVRFRAGRAYRGSLMPWENFRLMTDGDLVSLFRYFHSLEAVDRDPGPSYRLTGWKPERGKIGE